MVPRQRQAKQAKGNGVCTRGNVRPDNGRLRPKKVGKNLFQGVPAHIIIAVACGRRKMPVGHLMFLEGSQHAPRPDLFYCFQALESGRQLLFRSGNQRRNLLLHVYRSPLSDSWV